MALQNLSGGFFSQIGPGPLSLHTIPALSGGTTLDAAAEAAIYVGHIFTSDGASHTIDTTGSSSLGWLTAAVTFANAGTTVKVGLATIDAANGPPSRATNVANVITFDVSKSLTGGGGGITGSAWQNHVPDAGTKTIAHGDLVCFAVQMTARGGVDSVIANWEAQAQSTGFAAVTGFTGGSYASSNGIPHAIITFSDGAIGYFMGGANQVTINTRTWSSASATKEYGQLYKLPFPMKVHGLFAWAAPSADFDAVLYSDPLGTPVAEKTRSIDLNTAQTSSGRKMFMPFASPYAVSANQEIGAVIKPGASNVSAYYKTLNTATYRAADPWGTVGYGISRAAGAFANANVSLDHYYVGLIVSGYEHGVWPTGHLGV